MQKLSEKGNVYTVCQIHNDNWHPYMNYTETVNLKFRLDGKLIFTLHIMYHATMVDGELVVEHYFADGDCK